MTRRSEVLRGVSEASRLHSEFPTPAGAGFDIVGTMLTLGIPVMFRPLKGLWGATVTVDNQPGVLVTTKIGRPVQRFTLAHELGHIVLGHRNCFDETVGFAKGIKPRGIPAEEFGADAFASELLASEEMIRNAARRHGWKRASFSDPRRVYQLSLRLGLSFPATCYALSSNQVLTTTRAVEIAEGGARRIKTSLVPANFLEDSWADVWELTETDSMSSIEAGPFDVFILRMRDYPSAGYLWDVIDGSSRYELLSEDVSTGERYGDPSTHTFVLRFSSVERNRLLLANRRPWSGETTASFDVLIDARGKETEGLPRRFRERALAAVA